MQRRWVGLVILLGCGGSARPAAVIGHETGPIDDAREDELTVIAVNNGQELECARHDLALRGPTNEIVLEGTCNGACTEEDRAAGEAMVAEIEAGIAAGTSSDSELDYNFTECVFHGVELARWETVGAYRVALLEGHHPGPHDIPNRYFQLATLRCGEVWLSSELGATYANHWSADDLRIAAVDDAIVVTAGEGKALYRARFGACGSEPAETVEDAEPTWE